MENPMHPLAIDRRLGELERRVRRIEQHVRLPAEPAEELSIKSLLDPQFPEMQPASQHEFHPARVAAQPPAVPAPDEAPADAIILPYPPIPKPKPVLQNPLEQTIGIKWAGWVGAIVLVIGAALGIKYAYDNHLLPTVPPIMRLVMMSLGGFGLIAAGEWVYRKIGRLSASGFFGAGVATLFVISYGGYGAYSLYTRETALVMMAICTLIGSAVALRAQLVSVAVLALLGGNIAPLVLHGQITNPVPFLLYLLMLEAVALIVAHWGGSEKWWALRGLSLVTTSLWMAPLLARSHIDVAWAPEMWFALLYAVLFHAELLLLALRRAKRPVDESAGAVFSLLVTALISAAILRVFWMHEAWIRGMWMLTFAATTAVASVLVRTTLPKLAASFRVQAAALVILAVPVVLSGAAISIGWCVLALALAAVGGLISDRIARGAAAIAWALALVNLALWCAGHNSEATAIWMTVRGDGISASVIIAALIGLAGHEVALLAGWLREDNAAHRAELERFSSTFSFTASAVFTFAAIAGLPSAGATGVLIAYAWILFLVDRLSPRLKLGAQAWAALFLAAAKWAVIDSFITRSSPSWSAASYAPILNPLTVNAAALAASLVGMSRLRRQSLETDKRVAMCAALVLVWAGTLEIARMIDAGLYPGSGLWPHAALLQFAWTSWWMIGITGFLAYATRLDRRELTAMPALRNLAILPIALGIKFLTLDTIFGHGFHPVASAVVFNAQCATGGLVLAGLIFMRWLLPKESRLAFAAAAVGVLVPLWCGTMEIERAFVCSPAIGGMFADHMLAMQVACSIFFSIYAIACVVLGFAFQTAGLRYFGLALFALTLAKVGVLDMSRASTASRFLSFIGLGGLLLVTSVVYGKLSPKLLKADAGPKGLSSSPRPGQADNRVSL